ncbi:NADH-quinone oxidoreductase subunit F [Bryobacterales bacterium F-183]|nr:NADH-quinone oxidoreductase subunit F [Bryobacterales bacterium F-183]
MTPTIGKLYNEPHPDETRVLTWRFGKPNSWKIDTYLADGGYQTIMKALQMTQEQIIEEVKTSGLRGRGGAGFPTGLKWSFVPRSSPKPKYIVCNADESEPGTCKDRLLIEFDPHQLIEGLMIAGHAMGSQHAYVYIRGEYRFLIEHLNGAIDEAYAAGVLGENIRGTGFTFHVHTHSGAGAYECGEETALLDSLEGKRGVPRMKPPFPAVAGAWACPTLLNNVETFSAVVPIIRDGGAKFLSYGVPKSGGTRLLCVSGHVNKPGVYEVPLGMDTMTFINGIAGGVKGGKLKAVVPGGSSCPILTADECQNLPMDYDSVAKIGSMMGSGGMVVMNEHTDMVAVALRIIKFYQHESCGWCIPCREGTTWLKKSLQRYADGGGSEADIDIIHELAKNMLGRTFCALGDAAAMPTISLVTKFRSEFIEYLKKPRAVHQHELVGIH